MNIGSYLLASSYSATSPLLNTAGAVCTSNGRVVPCDGLFAPFMGILAFSGFFMVVFFAIFILMIVSSWKVYQKAGKPGWASIVPIYNMIVLLEIVNKPLWWIILLFIPFVNIIFSIIIVHSLSKSFGQEVGFTLGLIFLPFIFYPILAFGKYSYTGQVPMMPVTPVSNIPITPMSQPQTPPTEMQ